MTALPAAASGLPYDRAARRRAAIELGVLQGIYLLFLVPWFMVVIGGAMAAGSSGSLLAVLLFYVWAAYPVVALVTTGVAWMLYANRRPGPARWVNRVPLLWVVVGTALVVWAFLAS
ncbi:hypothetical protein DQ237_10775 [Blastococcus sp. TF02-8]|uniref:hypothetical protein n=1 Tax=Blastococcus sp. TF02-8 TaxID=2250574 RepID=UPI000DE9412D|nr:hypothetical protein [Blastococcus sp. TF02-8]RBY96325.1 hypothetical protein DQ237_10775 [Blastococcus sp. TF02-8]